MNSQMNQKSSTSQGNAFGQKSHANFIEALKSIGGQTARSVSHDVLGGVGRDFVQNLTGNGFASAENPFSHEEQINLEVQRIARQRELNETKVFDRKAEEIKVRVEVIRDELKMLAKELAGMDTSLEKAIEEEIANPGTYHVSFFEKLRRLILDLRKRVADSSSWMETASYRKASQGVYWGNVQKSGTKFLLSQERTMATQAG